MKVTIEFVIRDDKGNIFGQNSPLTLEIGTQSLHDIEGGVEQMKQKVLPEIEATLLTQAQNEFTEKVKEELNLWCNGTRKICNQNFPAASGRGMEDVLLANRRFPLQL